MQAGSLPSWRPKRPGTADPGNATVPSQRAAVDSRYHLGIIGGQGAMSALLINHAEEFLPRQRIVTEAAQHSARDEVCVRLMHAARGHAVMRRL